jgi:hypothetical protein
MIKAILIFLLLWSTAMAENKVSQIVKLRKQARAASKKDKVKLYPKIYKLMQQLSQQEWEHPIVKDLDKFFQKSSKKGGGSWYAQQAERPARASRPRRSGAVTPEAGRLIGSGEYKLKREGPPRLVHYRGRKVYLPPRIEAKLIADLNAVGWKGDFPVTSAFRTVGQVDALFRGAGRKPKFDRFLNDSKIPASYKNKLKNLVYSGVLKTNYENYMAKQAEPKVDGKKHYYSKDERDKNIPPIIWRDRGKLNLAIRKLLNERGAFSGTAAQKKAYIADLEKVIKGVRQKFGGFGSQHLEGDKVDIYQNAFFFPGGSEMLQKLQDQRGWFVHPESFREGKPTESNVFDVDLNGKNGKGSKIDFSKDEDYIDPVSKGKVLAHREHRKLERDMDTGDYQRIKKQAEKLDGPIVEEESEETITEETPTETATGEAPLTPETGMPYEDVSGIMDEVDKMSPDIQSRPTHPGAVDTSTPENMTDPGHLVPDQSELQQLDEQAIKQDSLPGHEVGPESAPSQPIMDIDPEIPSQEMPLDQPTPYGVYAKGQPEFAAAEEEQVLAAKDGVFVEKEKIKEEAEMGPIFPGQQPLVQEPVLPKGKTMTGEAPITPEQFQAQPDQLIQPTQPVQPPPTETVDEVVLEYVQGGKGPKEREKLNQLVKEGKTTREEIFKTIKKYDKPEPEDVMSAHARNMGQKPGPMMSKALGLEKKEVEKISKTYKPKPHVTPKPKPDVVEESGLEKVTKSFSGIPSDTDKKKVNDPEAYAKEMAELDQQYQTQIKQALKDEAEADVELQKVEPYRFWHSMSTPAKIVSALGALVAGYALPAEGAAAAYNMINSAIDADVKSQQLDIDHAMRVRKEATRRATNAIERRAKLIGNPETRFKIMEISRNLKANQVVKNKNNFKTRQKAHIMRNPEAAEKLFKHNPHMYYEVYSPEERKYHRKVNENLKKAYKDNNVSNVINAANAMENTFMDMDWKKVKGKMKLMKYDIAEPSGAGDMALVFSFMKMLDPGSVVREGEFKTAAGMNPQYLYFARKWNKFMEGEMFTTKDRLAFIGEVHRMLKAKVQDSNRVYNTYAKDLTRQGYPAQFILGKPISLTSLPSMKVNKAILDIMQRKGVDREKAIKIFNAARKRVAAKKRGVKFDKTGKPVSSRPPLTEEQKKKMTPEQIRKYEGKPLIGNKQFPIQSRIW